MPSLRFKICIKISPFLYSPELQFQQFRFTAVKICGVGSCILAVYRSVQMFELQYLHYIRGAQNPGDVCMAAPDILSIITAVFPYMQKFVSFHMHRAKTAKQQWGSEMTPQFGIHCTVYFTLLAPRIWEMLIDFWKLCTPCIIIIIIIITFTLPVYC